jgi:hypothetical protein
LLHTRVRGVKKNTNKSQVNRPPTCRSHWPKLCRLQQTAPASMLCSTLLRDSSPCRVQGASCSTMLLGTQPAKPTHTHTTRLPTYCPNPTLRRLPTDPMGVGQTCSSYSPLEATQTSSLPPRTEAGSPTQTHHTLPYTQPLLPCNHSSMQADKLTRSRHQM